MKTRHQVRVAPETALPYHRESAPNSSTILAMTVLAEIKDVLAVVRTAALLATSFKASAYIDVLGGKPTYFDASPNGSHAPLDALVGSVQKKLRQHRSARPPVFAVEANITAASFLTPASISVLVRNVEPVPVRPTHTR